jgi:protein tyrosine/serine phosphatase
MNKFTHFKALLITLLLSLNAFAELRERPNQWAKPILGSSLENFYKVDEGVYRSEQPNKEEFADLSIFGLTDVLNLREFHTDIDEASVFQLNLHHVRVSTGSMSEQQLIQALKIIQNRQKAIVVHCWHGSDRTGATIAAYRVVFNNWTKKQAIDELKNGGYGYHSTIYPNIVKLIEDLDVDKVKTSLGIKTSLKTISK